MSVELSSGGRAAAPLPTHDGDPHTNGAGRIPREARAPTNQSLAVQSYEPWVGSTDLHLSWKRSVWIPTSAIPWASGESRAPWAIPKNSDRAALAGGATHSGRASAARRTARRLTRGPCALPLRTHIRRPRLPLRTIMRAAWLRGSEDDRE